MTTSDRMGQVPDGQVRAALCAVLDACDRIDASIIPDGDFEVGQKTVTQAVRMIVERRFSPPLSELVDDLKSAMAAAEQAIPADAREEWATYHPAPYGSRGGVLLPCKSEGEAMALAAESGCEVKLRYVSDTCTTHWITIIERSAAY